MIFLTFYNLLSIWILTYNLICNNIFNLGKKLWLGVIISPIVGFGNLFLYSEDKLGNFDQIIYFSFATTVYVCFCIMAFRNDNVKLQKTLIKPKHKVLTLRWFGLVISNLYLLIVFAIVLVTSCSTLFIHGYGAVGELLSPINLESWLFVLLIASPALLLRKIIIANQEIKND